jgi:hypothetical protein
MGPGQHGLQQAAGEGTRRGGGTDEVGFVGQGPSHLVCVALAEFVPRVSMHLVGALDGGKFPAPAGRANRLRLLPRR